MKRFIFTKTIGKQLKRSKKLMMFLLLLSPIFSHSQFSNGWDPNPEFAEFKNNGKEFWTKQEWNSANTARFHFYMSKRVRESIRLHNLVRMYPDKFSEVYIDSLGDTKKVRVLRKTLQRTKPMHKLKPNVNLYLAAQMHTIYSGLSSHLGHALFDQRMMIVKPLSWNIHTGENCAYGQKTALDVSVGLLLSPGHRKNILNNGFYRIGGSRFYHIAYGTNTVFNYSTANWKDFSSGLKADRQSVGIVIGTSNGVSKLMLDCGLAYHANHFRSREYIAEIKYHKGVVNNNTDGLSLSVSSGNTKGLIVVSSGVKSTIYNTEGEYSFYMSPEITAALNIQFFKKGYLYYCGEDIVSLYRLTYGYNHLLTKTENVDISKHYIGVSKYINLKTKKI